MAWKDRPYYRDDRPHIGGFSRYSANTWLIIINVAVYFIGAILTNSMRGDFLSPYRWGVFSLDTAVLGGQIWRWVTFQFLHAGIFHLLINMLFLYFFGSMLEN